jgi:hypothetical protein
MNDEPRNKRALMSPGTVPNDGRVRLLDAPEGADVRWSFAIRLLGRGDLPVRPRARYRRPRHAWRRPTPLAVGEQDDGRVLYLVPDRAGTCSRWCRWGVRHSKGLIDIARIRRTTRPRIPCPRPSRPDRMSTHRRRHRPGPRRGGATRLQAAAPRGSRTTSPRGSPWPTTSASPGSSTNATSSSPKSPAPTGRRPPPDRR